MRSLWVALVCAACLAVAQASHAVASEDVAEYSSRFPPSTAVCDISEEEIDTKAFILVEKALFVPELIIVSEHNRRTEVRVVTEQEASHYEVGVEIRPPTVLDLSAYKRPGTALVLFEQKMWRQGVHLGMRKYQSRGGGSFQYGYFGVRFETHGHLYRAVITLYKGPLAEAPAQEAAQRADSLDTLSGDVAESQQALEKIERNVAKCVEALADLDRSVASNNEAADRAFDELKNQLTEIRGTVLRISRRVVALGEKVGG